jgi:cellulose synthase/poly-beta-1,6-N-acetylglucosamine synthase-like glycosyltransferase/peptidoglycan/xylan/chitin deacetylase (PgdA/CDA1 family)
VLRAAVVLTLVLFGVFLVRFTTVTTLMLARARRKAHAKRVADDDLPAITVIVPAYNEEAVIVATVSSLLGCAYPSPVQILVVDDGSTDGTLATARRAFDGHPQVRLLTKPNGGKCSALNLGIAEARTEIVVCIDADTQLDRDALRLLCRHFGDPDVGAVAGNPKVGNRINLLTRMQALEYVVLDSVERQALEGANAITCITGALGAYRRSLLETLGGYPGDTLAEDTDMTLLILRSGARVAYEEDAIAWTEAPETTRDFMKQRFRWMYGTVQAAFKYRAALFAQGSGSFGRVALPCLLLLQVGAGVLLLPLVDLVAVAGLAWLFAGGWFGWLVPGVSEMLRALDEHEAIFYALLGLTTMAAFAAAGVALHLDRREHLSRLLWLLPMQICFRVLLGMTAYRCILRAITGRHLAWGSLARTANVMVRAASAPSLQAKALARALLLVTVLATGAAAWQPVAAESPTATVVLYAPPSAVADGPELAPWHQWLYASGRRWREIASVHELVSAAPAVVLLPAARLLTEREVRALQRLQASGTALLVSGRIGAPQRDGTLPAGERLLGVALRPLVPPPGDGYHVSSIGHAPNTGSLPAGTRIAWREAAAWVPDTSRGTWLPAADFTTWSYRPVTGDVPLPAVLYGTHRGTRWVYLGFDAEWLDSDDAANVARLVADSLEWLAPAASAPRAQVAAWPPGYRSAQLVEMDTELAFRTDPRPLQHAIVLADILESVGARGSFYCVTSDVELSPAVLQRLAAGGHELGFHGEIHEQFAGQREPQQAARIATMLSQWQRLRPGTHGGGFRAPFEAYDVATERALVKAGIDYHVADPNAGPARLPHDAELGDGRRLLRLPRTQADDHVFTMGRQDAVTVARLLRVDADMAARSGALAVLSVHPQHFGIGAPVREAMPGLLEQLARPGSRVWLATGTEIASWWRTRERVRLQPLSDGLRIEVEPGPPIAGVTIIVNANLLARHIERADPSGARMLRALPWPAPDAPPWQSELRLFDLPAGVTEVRWGG